MVLSHGDALLCDRVEGRKTSAELEVIHLGDRKLSLRWYEAAVVEMIRPIESPPSLPRLIQTAHRWRDAQCGRSARPVSKPMPNHNPVSGAAVNC